MPPVFPRLSSFSSRLLLSAGLAFAVLGAALPAAAADYVALEPMAGKKVNIDGMLTEWPAEFVPLTTTLRGTKTSAQALVGYDATHLYFALKTNDAHIARTKNAGANEDHLTWRVRAPLSGKTYRIDVYPGDPGKLPGVVKVDGKTISAAEAVENPQAKGYFLEARLPWSAVPEAARARVGLRGVLEYTDASAPGRVRGVVATSRGQGAPMPPFTLEAETGLVQALLEPKALGFTPAREAYGNVAGGPELERVAVYGHFLSIVGPGYKGGKQFYFNELRVADARSVLRLELKDFDGDGRQEIVLQMRSGSDSKHREVLQVFQVGKDGAPRSVFAHEVAIRSGDIQLSNKVKLKGSGRTAEIEISQGEAKGVDPSSYDEPTIEGIFSALMPWESVKSRVFRWEGAGLAATAETSWTPKLSPPGARAAASSARADVAATNAPPPPRPPSADELLDRVYALYRKDRGVGKSAPRFDFVTDVVENEQPERVLVHGKDIVVFGKGFRQGQTYTFITVGVKDAAHILDVTARDLTGDGKAEIILRGILHAQASKELGGDTVRREALFVYKVIDQKLTRIFAAETGRGLGKKRIVGAVAFTPRGGGVDILLQPARAVGWTERDYPFPQDEHPAGGLEPLLLPWGRQKTRSYSFEDGSYQQR